MVGSACYIEGAGIVEVVVREIIYLRNRIYGEYQFVLLNFFSFLFFFFLFFLFFLFPWDTLQRIAHPSK